MPAEAVLIAGSHHRAQSLKRVLEEAGWRVRAHVDPAEALRDVRATAYDALFCDERLKGATPSGFYSWHQRTNADAPFYAIAASGSELEKAFRGVPAQVLPFPLTAQRVPPPPTVTQAGQREEVPAIPLEGDTSTVPLAHLIELLSLNDGTAVVETPWGAIHLANGRIEHASCAVNPGEEAIVGKVALAELTAAEDLAFKVLPYRPPPKRSVNLPTMMALTEAARLRDESMRNRQLLAAVKEGHPEVTGLAIGYPVNDAPDDALGDGAAAHQLLHSYNNATRALPAIGKPTHLALEGDGVAWAVTALKNGLVLSGVTARGRSLNLLATMVKSVRARESTSD